ncbi:pre-mRNA 3' end processing protein WDR33 [Drosophila obscura]|uniref:pre-mRNA 3' end processing protein WDR33 n=1 Tax=Drosophila obscura TaxID=7282 RepID=UPI000BA02834|nr:pre-mRNA 3' end processing protein WDR33 [Drosophila obscura]XP_022217834.1 pre-mRNA 3' end processing protein WDR33 [Drosophila obscura]XP_041449595.1 pre-mRNA 3' end processing protein WDR33 [Drosophila obscura]
MDVSQPPPQLLTAPSALATNFTSLPPPSMGGQHYRHYHPHHGSNKHGYNQFKPFMPGGFQRPFGMSQDDFDGKRLRKSVMRKTVDYNASIIKALENRLWQRDHRDRLALQPDSIYVPHMLPPSSYLDNPSNAVTTRFVKTATNKMRCPIFTLAWTPEGRRLVTGASSGEFTLWNGLTFNFETILQAHDISVRTMVWSHNDSWMVTGDHGGYVKYWQSNMNNVKMYQAHKEAIRGISFSPTDSKFVSGSDDGTLRIWDFMRCQEERVLRGHGADVKCVHWHPHKGMIVSGSKDNQQPIKIWDPKSGIALATLHAHKSTVMDLKWNDNGNWLVTASRDHLLKLFDIRNLREEVQVFRGHKKEASSVSWHPIHEGLFCSGGSDGSILFWNVGTDKEIGSVETAHDSIVWTLAWHPLGHILCSGSNDHTIKFWTRNRPGDLMRDKYNLNTLPASLAALDECEYDDAIIPGMGPEDRVEFTESLTADKGFIPGLDLDPSKALSDRDREKKVPYSKPIPRNFQVQWAGPRRADDPSVLTIHEELAAREAKDFSNGLTHQQISENTLEGILASGMLNGLDPHTIVGVFAYNRFIRVHPDSRLMGAIRQGADFLNKYVDAGKLEELSDVVPLKDRSRSVSPAVEVRGEVASPPTKKSRFEPRQHNAQLVCVRELLLLKKPFLPSLVTAKAQQPNTEFVDEPPLEQRERERERDRDRDRERERDRDPSQSNRPNPWAANAPWSNNGNGGSGGGGNGGNGSNGFSNNGPENFNERERDQFPKSGNNNNSNSGGQQRRRRGNNNSGSSGGGGGGGSGGSGSGRNRGRNNRRF